MIGFIADSMLNPGRDFQSLADRENFPLAFDLHGDTACKNKEELPGVIVVMSLLG